MTVLGSVSAITYSFIFPIITNFLYSELPRRGREALEDLETFFTALSKRSFTSTFFDLAIFILLNN